MRNGPGLGQAPAMPAGSTEAHRAAGCSCQIKPRAPEHADGRGLGRGACSRSSPKRARLVAGPSRLRIRRRGRQMASGRRWRARPDRPHPAKERRRAPEGPLFRAAADAACCAGSCRTPASPAAAYAADAGATHDVGSIRDRCVPPPAACRTPSTAAGQSSSAAGGARPAGAAFMSARAVRLQRAGSQNGRARPASLQRLFGGARDQAWADTRPRGSPAGPRATGETGPPLESWAPKAAYSPRRTGFPEKTPS